MKKSIVLLAMVGSTMFLASSCRKEMQHPKDIVIQKSVNVSLKTNQSYEFALPENTSDVAFQITAQASHFYTSELTSVGNTNTIYHYKPSKDFTGTDKVVISTVEEQHNGDSGSHNGGSCGQQNNRGQEQEMIVTINIVVIKDSDTNPMQNVYE